jgi:hypothetical protein
LNLARLVLLFGFVVFTWFGSLTTAQESSKTLIVIADHELATLISHRIDHSTLATLIRDPADTYQVVNERAVVMRHARYYLYRSNNESALSGIFRERLQTQGAIAIDLQSHLTKRIQTRQNPEVTSDSLLAVVIPPFESSSK